MLEKFGLKKNWYAIFDKFFQILVYFIILKAPYQRQLAKTKLSWVSNKKNK